MYILTTLEFPTHNIDFHLCFNVVSSSSSPVRTVPPCVNMFTVIYRGQSQNESWNAYLPLNSVDVWESYQASRKQRRSARESDKSDSKAFAMLLSSAINVSTTPPPPLLQDKNEPAEKEDEVRPRPSR